MGITRPGGSADPKVARNPGFGAVSGPPIEGATALPMGYDVVARSISARTTPSAGR